MLTELGWSVSGPGWGRWLLAETGTRGQALLLALGEAGSVARSK